MNWDAIGAVAELLGAVGVIGSLIYLASQIRDTRRALRTSTYLQLNESVRVAINSAVENPAVERSVAAGLVDYEGLADEDRFRFIFWMNGIMRAFENVHYQHCAGMLDADRWELHRRDLEQIFAGPGAKQWWHGQGSRFRHGEFDATPVSFSNEFSAVVSELAGD